MATYMLIPYTVPIRKIFPSERCVTAIHDHHHHYDRHHCHRLHHQSINHRRHHFTVSFLFMENIMQVEIHFEPVPRRLCLLFTDSSSKRIRRAWFLWMAQTRKHTHSNISMCNVLKFISINTSNWHNSKNTFLYLFWP